MYRCRQDLELTPATSRGDSDHASTSFEGRIRLRPRPRPPRHRVVVAAVARPWIEGVNDGLELAPQLRQCAHEHPLERRDVDDVPVLGLRLLHPLAGAVVVDPMHPERRIELRTETGSEEAVAEEPPR